MSDTVTIRTTMLISNVGMQPILPFTVPIKNTNGASHPSYVDGNGVVWCEQTLKASHTKHQPHHQH